MRKRFLVAGHLFEVEMPLESPLWGMMDNYAPFEIEDAEQIPVFTLEVEMAEPTAKGKLLMSGIDEKEPDMPRLDVYKSADGDGLHIEMAPIQKAPICGWLDLSGDYSKGRLTITSNRTLRAHKFDLDNALMLMYAFSTACLHTLEMHASVVENGGKAYMFLGVSGAGKSTHSRQWLENIPDTQLVNDDNPIVRSFPDGSVRVYGSPWSGKTPCYKKLEFPLAATVSIKKAPHNKMIPLVSFDSYSRLYSSCSGFRPDEKMADGMHETLEAFVMNVPGFEIECLPNADAAWTCKKAIDGLSDNS